MSNVPAILNPTEQDIQMLLAAQCHLGTKNVTTRMTPYVYKRRPDGINIINISKTWEKLIFAARAIAAIENPQDICVIAARNFGHRAALKFAKYVGAEAIVGRFTPGTFTNYITRSFREPRLIICTDPRTDHQAIQEASYCNIPVISLADTDSPLTFVDIAIPTNNKGKKVTLELGGKSPNIIFDDADLDQAVAWAHKGIFFNHGQVCCAGSRIYVQEGIYDKFLERFKEYTSKTKVGDPFDMDTFQGAQVSQVQFDRIMSYIEQGKKEGATCYMGGNRLGDKGYFIEPTVFTDVKEEHVINKEEIFGPVVAVSKFKTLEEVVEKANNSTYGLAAAVFTSNISTSINVANKLEAGTVWVNCFNELDYNTPFGGYKQSGIGRENGEYALDNYYQVKSVKINIGL